MSSITIGGISSGLDTASIISALVGAKTASLITPLENKVSAIEIKQSYLSSFKSLMQDLQSTASDLKSATFTGRSATSSDTDKLDITSTDDTAVAGTYSVLINALAQYDRNYFDGAADTDTTTFGTGTIQITSSGVTRNIVIDSSNNTLEGIRDAINETSGIGVTASIVNDGTSSPYRLVLTSNSTGSDADITQNLSSILSLTAASATTIDINADATNQAQNAEIEVNGLTITNDENTFVDAIPGITMDVSEVETTSAITVRVQENFSSIESSISSFVSAYNTLAATLQAHFAYDETTNTVGVLAHDITLQNAQSNINSTVLGLYNNVGNSTYKSLASLGITLDDNGDLTIDSDTLEAALSDSSNEVTRLFQGNGTFDGLAQQLYDYLDKLTNSTDGIMVSKDSDWSDQIDDINSLIDSRQTRIDAYQANLEARYAYLETYLAQLQTDETTLTNFSDSLSNLYGRRR